jgi:hypothetical protein
VPPTLSSISIFLIRHELALTKAGEATKECHELFLFTRNIFAQYKLDNSTNTENARKGTMLDGYISSLQTIVDDILIRINDIKDLFQSLTSEKRTNKLHTIMTKAKINDMKRDQAFKLSKRNILGVKTKGDWIEDTNIGNIMRITPLKLDDIKSFKEAYEEISKDSLLEKVILLGICYFSLSTELRLIDEKMCKFKVESERIHAKAVEVACMYLPPTCPLVEHVSNSYLKFHSSIGVIVNL